MNDLLVCALLTTCVGLLGYALDAVLDIFGVEE